jgi:hypothetical protein
MKITESGTVLCDRHAERWSLEFGGVGTLEECPAPDAPCVDCTNIVAQTAHVALTINQLLVVQGIKLFQAVPGMEEVVRFAKVEIQEEKGPFYGVPIIDVARLLAAS